MIPRREEAVDTTPLSPRISNVTDESDYLEEEDYMSSAGSEAGQWEEERSGTAREKLRHAVGIALLLATVFLWTASNFMSSVRISDAMVALRCKMRANVWTDNIRRLVLLETILGNLRQYRILHNPPYTHVHTPPLARPSPYQRQPAAPTTPLPLPRPAAAPGRKMDTTSRPRIALVHLKQSWLRLSSPIILVDAPATPRHETRFR
jgi:hypothetical protein